MKHRLGVALAVGLCVTVQAIPARATVLTFDDLVGPDFPEYSSVPSGYGGLDWFGFSKLNGPDNSSFGVGWANGTVSPSNVAYNDSGIAQVAVISASLFDFNGAYLTSAALDGLSIEVNGFREGDSLYDEIRSFDTAAPTFSSFNYLGIDALVFTPFFGDINNPEYCFACFAMDNFTFNEPFSEVPESSTMGLLATGLLGMMRGVRRRHRQAA